MKINLKDITEDRMIAAEEIMDIGIITSKKGVTRTGGETEDIMITIQIRSKKEETGIMMVMFMGLIEIKIGMEKIGGIEETRLVDFMVSTTLLVTMDMGSMVIQTKFLNTLVRMTGVQIFTMPLTEDGDQDHT